MSLLLLHPPRYHGGDRGAGDPELESDSPERFVPSGAQACSFVAGVRRNASLTRCDMKGKLLVTSALSFILLMGASGRVLAHHGNAAYADNITEFKQAKVTQFAWANPHALILSL